MSSLAVTIPYIRAQERALGEEGILVRGIVRVGNPAEAILELAEKEKASLIVLSTHGRTGLSRWIFGSVAEKVLRGAKVPLLIVRSSG